MKAPSCSGGDRLKLKLKLRLNLNGCAGLEEVQNAVEEEYDDKVPRPAKVRSWCWMGFCWILHRLQSA